MTRRQGVWCTGPMTDTPARPVSTTNQPLVVLGTRVVVPQDYLGHFECSACGASLRGLREAVAVPRNQRGYVLYSLVHADREECLNAVT